MRLIGSIDKEELAKRFAAYLTKEHISFQIEPALNRDWGSDAYGTPQFQVWILDEDQFDQASELLNRFKKDPNIPYAEAPKKEEPPQVEPTPSKVSSPLTFFIVSLCTLLFLWNSFAVKSSAEESGFLYFSPVNRTLLYDYPRAFEIINQILSTWGVEGVKDTSSLPPEGQFLVQEFNHSPVFQGFYPDIVAALRKSEPPPKAPLFEKISQGELWRFFTPALLHSNLFHILFNMIWLVLLGRQIEERMGLFRMLLFILIAAAFSNTCQYLMSGASFMGFSGVIAAMLAFIWVRTKKAPWEGYMLDDATFAFVGLYILAFFLLQLGAFFYEVVTGDTFTFGMANTAHLAGAFIGYLLGRWSLFHWRHA